MLEHRIADELEAGRARWAAVILDRLAADVPSLLDGDERQTLGAASTQALLGEFAAALRTGIDAEAVVFHAPPAALGYTRHLARHGVALAQILRSYRLGQELLFARAAELSDDTESLSRIGRMMFRYLDGVVADVAELYDREREAALTSVLARRERLVEQLLAGATVDRGAAERTLGRRLDGHHLAAVAWRADTGAAVDPDAVAAALAPLLAELGDGRPLVLLGAAGDVFAWVTPRPEHAVRRAELAGIRSGLDEAGVRVALGTPGAGTAGFIDSRRQADAARSVAHLRPQEPIVRYTELALLHLLLRDRFAADTFAAEQLAGLGGGDRRRRLLRHTVAAYLTSGRDATRTAHELGVHRNTVSRRLARAEQLLGRPLHDRPDELSVALAIVGSDQASKSPE